MIHNMKRTDIPAMFEIIKDNLELTKHMTWEPPSTIEETYKIWETRHVKEGQVQFTIFHEGEYAGRMGIEDIGKSAEFGLWMNPKFQGRGFATEAGIAVINWAFENLEIEKVTSKVFIENKASQRVHDKIGFKEIGVIKDALEKRGKMVDEYAYELLAKDFLK